MAADKGRQVTIGLDLGGNLGWACVRGFLLLGFGVKRLKDKSMAQRCSLMAEFLRETLFPQHAVRVGVEQPPYVKRKYTRRDGTEGEGGNLRTYGILNQYFGVANAMFVGEGTPVTGINALTLKKWATGSGHATKEQVQQAMARLSGYEELLDMPSDAADAVACAYYVNSLVDPRFWADVKEWRVL